MSYFDDKNSRVYLLYLKKMHFKEYVCFRKIYKVRKIKPEIKLPGGSQNPQM